MIKIFLLFLIIPNKTRTNTMLAKNILYAIKLLSSNSKFQTFGRTIVQKIMFFSLPRDKRNSYYIPYFYGPYSDNIQMLLRSLENSGYLTYKNNSYEFNSEIKTTSDIISKRIKNTIDFLNENKITTTNKVSNLAKVYMILDENNLLLDPIGESTSIPLVKKKARFVGWQKLSRFKSEQIKIYISQANALEKTFEKRHLN